MEYKGGCKAVQPTQLEHFCEISLIGVDILVCNDTLRTGNI